MGYYIWYNEEGTGWGRSPPGPPRRTKRNSPPIIGQCTNLMLLDLALLLAWLIKGLSHTPGADLAMFYNVSQNRGRHVKGPQNVTNFNLFKMCRFLRRDVMH